MRLFLALLFLLLPACAIAGPPPWQGALNKPFGIVAAGYDGALPKAEDQRPPLALDDFTRGYFPSQGSWDYGPLWQYQGAVWQLNNAFPGYQQSDWLRVSAPLPCDPGALSVPCGVYFGTIKGVSAYAGNVGTLWRASDQTTLTIPFIARGGFYVADQNMMNRFCTGAPVTQRCWFTVLNDQTGNGNNAVPAYSGAISDGTAVVAQSGTFTGSSVITLADTGGTCTQHTQIYVDALSGTTITAWHIGNYSRCSVMPTNGTQASTAVTGGGTSASFTMTYGYPEAMEYLPYISINGMPAVTCGSQGSNQGPDLINQQHACTMTVPNTAWQPHVTTFAGIMTQKASAGTAPLVSTPDGIYGWQLTQGGSLTPAPFGMNAHYCTAVNPLSTPAVVVLAVTGTTAICYENDQVQRIGGERGSSESATGMVLGGGNGSSFTFTALFDVPNAVPADINVMRIGLTSMGGVQPQIRTQLDVGGASMTYGAGEGEGQNYTTVGNFTYRRGIQEVNQAVSSQPLCTEDSQFLTPGLGDSQMYNPYASLNIVLNVGEMNDVGANSAGGIHGCRAHIMYQWQQLATGYFLAAASLANSTGVSGYANNDVITLAPPAGVTCSVAPQLTALAVGSPGAGVPGTATYVSTPGWCVDAAESGAGTWTQASTTGTGTGATYTVTVVPRSPVTFVSGEVPPQCTKWRNSNLIPVIYGQYQDIVANLNTPAPPGGCTTQTSCTATTGGYAGGAGLRPVGMNTTSVNDYAADPIVGFGGPSGNISFPGPFAFEAAGAYWPAGIYPIPFGSPSIPFCSTTYSGTGDHPNAYSAQLMWGNLQATINAVLPPP